MKGRLLDAVPLSALSGVGASQSAKLAKIGLHTVQDLLFHLPYAMKTAPAFILLASCCRASTRPLKAKSFAAISFLVAAA